jgi:hypothetical protein
MAGSVNKVILVELYQQGKSIPDVAATTGAALSTVRYHLKAAGVLRSRAEGVRLAGDKLGSGMRGKRRIFSASHKQAISSAKRAAPAKGISLKPNGYIEFTRGENKGRGEHVVIMEQRIGRRLRTDEIVHHIDGNRSNNDDNNLALMTRAAHMRLHRREKRISGKVV